MDGEFYTESSRIIKDRSNRYKDCKVLTDIDEGITLLSTREIKDIPSSPNDKYHRVKSHESQRLDLIAHTYYKNPLLWWVIAQANEIYDPFTYIEPGTIIRIPSIETLYGNRGILL